MTCVWNGDDRTAAKKGLTSSAFFIASCVSLSLVYSPTTSAFFTWLHTHGEGNVSGYTQHSNAAVVLRMSLPEEPLAKVLHGVSWLGSHCCCTAAGKGIPNKLLQVFRVVERWWHGSSSSMFLLTNH